MQLIDENDPVLRTEATEINTSSPHINIDMIAREMYDIMIANNGIGLAGPQVGLPYKIFIMNVAGFEIVVNPKIIEFSEEFERAKEGCLSFPGLQLNVKRAKHIKVEYYNEKGEKIKKELEGFHARCFQHETDHVNGICFDEQVPKVSLKIAKNKMRK